jgi:hypothetical protein
MSAGKPWVRVASGRRHTEYKVADALTPNLYRIYASIDQPEFLKAELETLNVGLSRVQSYFHEPDYVVAELKESARNLERWYKLMLVSGYLEAEVKAMFSRWNFVSLENQLPENSRKADSE